MKRAVLFLYVLLWWVVVAAQSSDLNYVSEITYLDATSAGASDSIVNTVYYDGLGRSVQTVTSASGATNDIVNYTQYDARGRVSNRWIPTPGVGNGRFTDIANIVSKNLSLHGTNERGAFSAKSYYETSPESRLKESRAPGYVWNSRAGVTRDYGINTSSGDLACLNFLINPDDVLIYAGNLPSGEARTETITDEDGNKSIFFYGRNDSILLERRICETGYADTYHVYDRLGNRRFVIPPMAVEHLKNTTPGVVSTASGSTIGRYGYSYCYDSRNRLIEKRLPGVEPIYYLYDKQGLLRYMQDGNLRQENKYIITYYDVANRVSMTGCKVIDTDIASLRSAARENGNEYTEFFADDSAVFGMKYFTPAISREDVMSVNYYDDYRFVGLFEEHGSQLDYRQMSGYDEQYVDSLLPGTMKGYRTGRLTRVLDTDVLLVEALYYDSRGRVIQSHCSNHLGGYDHRYYRLTFTGKPLEVRHEHSTATRSHVDIYRYSYDAMERLLAVSMQHDDGEETILQSNTYDAIGRLATQTIDNGATPINHTYNVRGWVTKIESAPFTQTLYYEIDDAGNVGYYNGNIYLNEIEKGESQTMSYRYTYDNLNRLTKANITGTPQSTSIVFPMPTSESDVMPMSSIIADNNVYSTPTYSTRYEYDLNGNITYLVRYGLFNNNMLQPKYKLLNSLSYTYTGNQVTRILDGCSYTVPSIQMAFDDIADEDVEYTWDANGNMTSDLNKGITSIEYNHLNLPRRITCINGHVAEYLYDADGRKLQTKYMVDNRTVFAASTLGETDEDEVMGTTDSTAIETLLIRDYADSYIYSDSVMERIITPAGDYTPTDGYRYFIRDYQGNVMAVVKGAELKQWNYYYPDGTPFSTSTAENRFMFSGKELDSMNALYWYDFHARYYDPLIGITPTQDRHAEKYYPYSPYSYCFGNPVKYIDPTGMDVAIIISPKSVKRFGHIALLVQNENKEWRYYSVNGDDKYIIGSHSGAKTTDDIDVPVAGDPQLFLDSDGGGKEYDYEKAFVIPTTSEQDQIIAETFEKESEKDYNLIGSNCATAVANSLKSAGVSIEVPQIVAPPGFNRIINKTLGNSIIPKGLYNEIKQMQKSIGYEIVKE